MNFNQQSPDMSSLSGMNPNQQPQQRGGNLPALTPQMLQSLTPQQFELFKSNPHFQEMMRQYMQKQQLIQQQQRQQQQPQPSQQHSTGGIIGGMSLTPPPLPPQQQPQQQQVPLQQQQQQPPPQTMQMAREQFLKQQQMMLNQQRMAQQQQQAQQGSHGPQSINNGMPGASSMPYRQQMPNQMSPDMMNAQQQSQQQQHAAPPPHLVQQQSHQQIPTGMNKPPPPQGRVPSITGAPGAMGPPLTGVPGATPLVEGPGAPSPVVGGAIQPSGPNSIPGVPPSAVPPSSSMGPGIIPGAGPGPVPGASGAMPQSNLPPGVTPEILSKLPSKPLLSFHEWSDKLKEEGKEIPLDLKVYEEMIRKDTEFMGKLSRQLIDNKSTMEGLAKDIQSYNQIKQLRMNSITLSNKNQFNNSIWGEGYQGYGNGITNSSTKLMVPGRDITDRMINERVLKNLKMSKHYVPIRLEFDQERDQFKLRDTFLWDLNEEIIKIEDFTRQLIDDYKFIPKEHYETILASIKEQISDYLKKPNKTMGELRIPIKVDITINNTQLTDQFEWDILNSLESDPEEFAFTMCEELCLPGEFCTAIAHTIREQSQMYIKALNTVGYSYSGAPVNEDEIRNHLLPSLRLVSSDYEIVDDFFSILRNPTNVPDFSPSLNKLSQLEVERLDKEMERESRRKRRHNYNEDAPQGGGRGFTSRRIAAHASRGNNIPDLSDIPKTFRTPAPSSILPGSADLGTADVYEYNEVIINRTQVRNPNYRPPTPVPVDNGLVDYDHDPIDGTFIVTIKLP